MYTPFLEKVRLGLPCENGNQFYMNILDKRIHLIGPYHKGMMEE
jgi:hypothetical protein